MFGGQCAACTHVVRVIIRQVLLAAQGTHQMFPPGVPIPRDKAQPVQSARDDVVRIKASHLLHDLHSLEGSPMVVFAGLRFRDAQFRVSSARPMYQHDHVVGGLVYTDDDLLNKGSDYPLLDP